MSMNEVRTAHWRQKWSMPGTPWTITGFSRAAYRTGFYIPELNILLDAGPQNWNHPSHIFITHTHGDHIANLPFTFIDENPDHFIHLFAPLEAESHLRKYISCLFEVNSLKSEAELSVRDWYEYHGYNTATTFRTCLNKSTFEVDVVICDHSVPTISYCFSLVKQKLKAEFSGLPHREIGQLRKSGTTVTEEVVSPSFAFVCDTSIEVLVSFPKILLYPIVIIECTFLYPEERDNARDTKHIHWEDIRPYVVANPSTVFVLIHFSLRYKEEEILEFFRQQRAASEWPEDCYSNLKVWAGDTTKSVWDEDALGVGIGLRDEDVKVDESRGGGGCCGHGSESVSASGGGKSESACS
jgi:ribonuclease Z